MRQQLEQVVEETVAGLKHGLQCFDRKHNIGGDSNLIDAARMDSEGHSLGLVLVLLLRQGNATLGNSDST